MKKIISILISAVIALQLLVLPVSAETEEKSEYWNTMVGFGVIAEDAKADGTFTIAEMSQMIYRLLNLTETEEPEATRQIYTDVDRWHWAAGYIEWLYTNNVYTGDGSGIYEPDRETSLSDVCTLALNLLGYKKMMEYTGDTANVIEKAVSAGLLSSKVNKKEHAVTIDEFSSICYELLYAEVIKEKFSIETGFIPDGEFITEVLELNYGKGVITGANGYSFVEGNCSENYVVVDGKKLSAMGADFSEYIGYNVKYYYDNDENLIAAIPVQNSEITIMSSDILSYNSGRYNYEVNERRKKADTDTGVLLLYNGKPTSNRNAFVPAYGQVRLIDNDNDGKYDCVISEDVYNVIVEIVADGIIYGKNTNSDGKKYVIDTEDFELLKINVPIEEIKTDSVVTVAVSEDGKYASLTVSEKKVSGILTKYDESEKICIGNAEYEPAAIIYNPNSINSSGNDVEILMDAYGNVFAVLGTHNNKYVLGYLMSSKVTDDDVLILKILTRDGIIKKTECGEKLYVDGSRIRSASAAQLLLTNSQVIKYKLSDGKIKYIDTAVQNAGTNRLTAASDDNSLRMFAKGTMLYKSASQIFKKYGSMSLLCEFAVSDDSTVFFVPSTTEYTGDSDYYTGTKNDLANDYNGNVEAYVTGAFDLVADAVVVTYTTGTTLSSAIAVVSGITTGLNSDDEVVQVVKGMQNGSEIEFTVSNPSILTANGKVEKGSVIRFAANKNGDVRHVDNLYSINGQGKLNTAANHTFTSGSTGVNANVRLVYGRVTKKNGTVVQFSFADNAADDEIFNLRNCNFYVYSKADGLRNGTVDDIYDFEHYGSGCDEVIICTRAANTSDVVLIRK